MPPSQELVRRAARLFCVGFEGRAVPVELRELLELGVSGVILFSRNVGEPRDVHELTRTLKALRTTPLLVTVDQEGGPVRRLRAGFTEIPPFAALGATDSVDLARALGALFARELRAVGIDWDLAPVLDVDSNPQNPVIGVRSLGKDPNRVAELGVAFALAMEEAGVASCAKHFPGHGDTELDSHRDLPRLDHPMDRLERVELVPFAVAAHARVASIMTAHVIFSALDREYPATLSRNVLHGVLRERFGYDGLVVSDDLEMAAVLEHYGIEEAVVRGVRAGVDLFLVCHTPARMHQAIEALVHAVEDGRLSEAELEGAERRVSSFATRWALPPPNAFDTSALRRREHLDLAERLAAHYRDVGAADPTGAR